jgi:hypothetical protein
MAAVTDNRFEPFIDTLMGLPPVSHISFACNPLEVQYLGSIDISVVSKYIVHVKVKVKVKRKPTHLPVRVLTTLNRVSLRLIAWEKVNLTLGLLKPLTSIRLYEVELEFLRAIARDEAMILTPASGPIKLLRQ